MFKEYVMRRLIEDFGLTIDEIKSMILQALGADTDPKDAGDAPLVQYASPNVLVQRFNSVNSLSQLLQASPAALEAIQAAKNSKLTVGQPAGMLYNQGA